MPSSPVRQSRISMLLVVLIGGLVLMLVLSIALLLPAIRAARDAAQRQQTGNETRQVEKAVEAYQGKD